MKILYFTSRIPFPLDKGDKLRAYYQLKFLNERHDVHLVALNDEGEVSDERRKELSRICSQFSIINLNKFQIGWRLTSGLLASDLPFQVHYFYSRKIQKLVDKIVSNYQPGCIYAQLIRTAEYVRNQKIPKMLDMMDALSKGMERRADISSFPQNKIFAEESRRLKKYESEILNDFDNVLIISEQDASIFSQNNKERISVIPNGIGPKFLEDFSQDKTFDLAFVGNLSYPPNIDAAEFLVTEVLPILKRENENVKLLIAGANPSLKVKSMVSESIVVQADLKDIRTAYASARVFVAPMRIGSGLQNKLLEAMALGLPCVTTTLCNAALMATPNDEILVADSAQEIASKVEVLLENNELRKTLSQNGKELVLQKFRWETVNEQIEKLILNNT